MKRNPTHEELKGTTVNERLYLCGLIDEFDRAKRNRNKERMVETLETSGLPKEAAESTVAAIMEKKSGFLGR